MFPQRPNRQSGALPEVTPVVTRNIDLKRGLLPVVGTFLGLTASALCLGTWYFTSNTHFLDNWLYNISPTPQTLTATATLAPTLTHALIPAATTLAPATATLVPAVTTLAPAASEVVNHLLPTATQTINSLVNNNASINAWCGGATLVLMLALVVGGTWLKGRFSK